MRRFAVPIITLLVLTAAPAAAAPTFAYTPAPPGEAPDGAVVVMPEKREASMPAALWVHWLGEPATTNHTEFLADARSLAARGAVSLLVDMPWSQKDWFTAVRTPDRFPASIRRAPPTSGTTSERWTERCCSRSTTGRSSRC
jgi:hypothetical protein